MCIFVARGSTLVFWWEQFCAEWEPAISSYYWRLETQQQSSAQLLGLISDTFSFQNGTKILIKSFELVNQPVDSNHPGLHQSLARDQALSSHGQKSVCLLCLEVEPSPPMVR